MDNELEKYGEQQEEALSIVKNKRIYDEEKSFQDRITVGRDNQERDYARVLYSSSFRRLQGKMQLFIPYTNRFNRNRLTHSLEVAQVARVIAKKLGLKDTLTVQSCSLAHDIGHPPFGHAGEETLNNINNKAIKFEGNAQSFRILNHLEKKHPQYNGLNLTVRTLLGTVKYFQNHKENNHKFLYDSDYNLVQELSETYNIPLKTKDGKTRKTVDAEIMDIADEIAYAAHDLEDALSFKWFSVDELIYEFSVSETYKDALPILEDIIKKAKIFANQANRYKSSEEYLILFKKELTSWVVHELVNNLCIKNEQLAYKENYDLLSEGLKKLTYHAVSRSSINKLYELKGKKIITKLYEVYMDKEFNKNMQLLPPEYREDDNWERNTFDYISGMMDEYAITKYKEYFGEKSLEGIYTNTDTAAPKE